MLIWIFVGFDYDGYKIFCKLLFFGNYEIIEFDLVND